MGGKVVPFSIKLDNAVRKYGDQFVRKNDDCIECSLCNKTIFRSTYSESSIPTLVRQHVHTMKHRDNIANGGMIQIMNQRNSVEENDGSASSTSSAKMMSPDSESAVQHQDVYDSGRPRRSVAVYECYGMKEDSPPPPERTHKRRRSSKRESDEYREHNMALDSRIKELKIQKLEADIEKVNEEKATLEIKRKGKEEMMNFYREVRQEISYFFKSIDVLIDTINTDNVSKAITARALSTAPSVDTSAVHVQTEADIPAPSTSSPPQPVPVEAETVIPAPPALCPHPENSGN